MMDYLNKLIAQALLEADSYEPQDVANVVIARIPQSDYRMVLRGLLPQYIRQYYGTQMREVGVEGEAMGEETSKLPPSGPRVDFTIPLPVFIRGIQMDFADMTSDDCRWRQGYLQGKARELSAAGKHWSGLAAQMDAANAKTVRDFGVDRARKILNGAFVKRGK
jgi:hypothetical protein